VLVGRNADAGVGKRLPDDYVRDQVGWDDHEYPFHTKGDRLYFRERGGTSGVYCRTLFDRQYSSEVKCDDPFGRGSRVGRFH